MCVCVCVCVCVWCVIAQLVRLHFMECKPVLKSFEGENKALALASRLEGAAFENDQHLEKKRKTGF